MKKLLLMSVCLILFTTISFSQKEAKLTVEISNDSILLGNYIEVKFTIENAAVKEFKAPNFTGFNIVGGPNQSSSTMITNGAVTQSVSYSYYLEPLDIGSYFIQPAYVETADEMLESTPMEVFVVDNPDGIIQPIQPKGNDFFNQHPFFGGNELFNQDPFFDRNDFFNDFFNRNLEPFKKEGEPVQPNKKTKKKKVYKL